jgi:hypothetical protein
MLKWKKRRISMLKSGLLLVLALLWSSGPRLFGQPGASETSKPESSVSFSLMQTRRTLSTDVFEGILQGMTQPVAVAMVEGDDAEWGAELRDTVWANQYFGYDLGLSYLGHFRGTLLFEEGSKVSFEERMIAGHAAGLGRVSLGRQVQLYGRVGLAYWWSRLRISEPDPESEQSLFPGEENPVASAEKNGWDPLLEAGLQWQWTPKTSFQIHYRTLDVRDVATKALSLGVTVTY